MSNPLGEQAKTLFLHRKPKRSLNNFRGEGQKWIVYKKGVFLAILSISRMNYLLICGSLLEISKIYYCILCIIYIKYKEHGNIYRERQKEKKM